MPDSTNGRGLTDLTVVTVVAGMAPGFGTAAAVTVSPVSQWMVVELRTMGSLVPWDERSWHSGIANAETIVYVSGSSWGSAGDC